MEKIVKTSVAIKIQGALHRTLQYGGMLAIIGGARIGKTFVASGWARDNPDERKVIPVPCSKSMLDLLLSIAFAYEIEIDLDTPQRILEAKVRQTMALKQVFPIFDEAHELWASVHRCTWWEHAIVDASIPHAIILAPRALPPGTGISRTIARQYQTCMLSNRLSAADQAKLASEFC